MKIDITDESSCEAAVQAAIDEFGRVDILCSNAGIYPSARLDEMTEEKWDTHLRRQRQGHALHGAGGPAGHA